MSRVVLYRCVSASGGEEMVCTSDSSRDVYTPITSPSMPVSAKALASTGWKIEPFIPASVARGLVEALKELLTVQPDESDIPAFNRARAALAAAEEALK